GGKFMPSLIAEIGEVIERHLIEIGMIRPQEPDERQKQFIEQKRAEFEEGLRQQDAFAENRFPAGAQLCMKCNNAAVVMMDGCLTCLNCGDSKCG
ncbi:MAG: NrdJb, partial [Ktedonobacteraceae bacterium]